MNPVTATPDPLAGLRAYHLPASVSWWPPAPGWWLLAVLLLVSAAVLTGYLVHRHRGRAAARLALSELGALREQLAAGQGTAVFLPALSRLLRRFALARFPRARVAGLAGDPWLSFLDLHGGNGRFSAGPGRALVEGPYRPQTELPANELADLVEEWIRHNQERRP